MCIPIQVTSIEDEVDSNHHEDEPSHHFEDLIISQCENYERSMMDELQRFNSNVHKKLLRLNKKYERRADCPDHTAYKK